MNILALDLSLTSTGWAKSGVPYDTGTIRPPTTMRGMRRLAWIRERVLNAALSVNLVVIEDYAMGMSRRVSALASLAELGGVIRLALYDVDKPFVTVAPALLKKYLAGRGNAKKEDVLAAAIRRLKYQGSSFDEADALTLLYMALDHYGSPQAAQMPKANRDALLKVRWPAITTGVPA